MDPDGTGLDIGDDSSDDLAGSDVIPTDGFFSGNVGFLGNDEGTWSNMQIQNSIINYY